MAMLLNCVDSQLIFYILEQFPFDGKTSRPPFHTPEGWVIEGTKRSPVAWSAGSRYLATHLASSLTLPVSLALL